MENNVPEFYGIDHVDIRVRNLARVRAFYDALFPALGLATIVPDGPHIVEYYEAPTPGRPRRFVGIIEDPAHVPPLTRIAFALPTRADVDRLAAFVRTIGASDVEDPQDDYYAVFFEDPDGTKLKACARG